MLLKKPWRREAVLGQLSFEHDDPSVFVRSQVRAVTCCGGGGGGGVEVALGLSDCQNVQ